MSEYKLIQASAHNTGLAAKSVHCAITSPPYYGLRAYAGEQMIEWPALTFRPMPGMDEIQIPGCDPLCSHEWGGELLQREQSGRHRMKWETGGDPAAKVPDGPVSQGAYCIQCGGWRGPLGLEPDLNAYIGHLILVLRETGRVLRDDGLFFVNLGDSYSGNATAGDKVFGNPEFNVNRPSRAATKTPDKRIQPGLKPKDLMLVPARFALAAQAEGWYVRSAMPWIKRNGMPESVTDRPAQTIESIYMLAKSEKYFWDGEAVKMPNAEPSGRGGWQNAILQGDPDRYHGKYKSKKIEGASGGSKVSKGENVRWGGRNLRASDPFFATWQGLWTDEQGDPLALIVNPRSYRGAHFATFPEMLPEVFIRAATSAYGVCPTCGAPWRRCVENTSMVINKTERNIERGTRTGTSGTMVSAASSVTTGWAPGCTCPDASQVQPATVYDPFSGSGTTGKVALRLGRSYVGVDLSSEYLEDLAPARLSNVQMEMQL